MAHAPAIASKPIERTLLFVTDRLSFGVGYMRGLVNGYKYRARLAAPDDLADAIQSAALVGDAMAQAHAEREIADARATEGTQAAPSAEARQNVLPHLLSALRWAGVAGCPSLSLKTLLQARDLGVLPDLVQGFDLQRWARPMADSISGEADHLAALRLVLRLSDEPVSAEGPASSRRADEQPAS
jgi:hypothetical protein